VLATDTDASLRKGAEAVTLAKRAVQLSGGQEPLILDTLAAAYAEAGRFDQAVTTAQQALALALNQGNAPLANALRAHIKLYQAGVPCREPR
jgi:Flp pilus assembly protein TadD